MSPDASIEAHNISVLFPLYHGNSRSLKKMLVRAASGRLAEDQQHRVVVRALSDINFSLTSGERLGLVGSNGAGKTTLLRVLAGIYEPVSGHVRMHGMMNALLDTSLGMNPELTGRENIIRPRILLMDEWFLAGDAAFLEKARQRMEGMVRAADILVLSTHSASIVREWCTRVIWLDKGRIRADGAVDEVLEQYLGTPAE
jgi:lipopolysaccharide transport system ATP-binding protein